MSPSRPNPLDDAPPDPAVTSIEPGVAGDTAPARPKSTAEIEFARKRLYSLLRKAAVERFESEPVPTTRELVEAIEEGTLVPELGPVPITPATVRKWRRDYDHKNDRDRFRKLSEHEQLSEIRRDLADFIAEERRQIAWLQARNARKDDDTVARRATELGRLAKILHECSGLAGRAPTPGPSRNVLAAESTAARIAALAAQTEIPPQEG